VTYEIQGFQKVFFQNYDWPDKMVFTAFYKA